MTGFADIITTAEITPGPIAVNAATFVGIQVAGLPGALIATIGCIFPSCVIVMALAYMYYRFRGLSVMQGILAGLHPAVIAMIASAGISLVCMALYGQRTFPADLGNMDLIAVAIFLVGFVILRKWKPSPIKVMAGAAVAGVALYSIVEFEVYKVPVVREPQNLLLNKSVSASSSHFSCPASKVNDGDASQGSRWAAANSDLPAWLEFNLGSEQTFNSVTITENIVPNWASERITGLEFQAWNGTEYTTISTYSGTIGTSKPISLPETTSSKFKVLITGLQEDTTKNSKGQTDPSIQEIELYYR